MSRGQLARTPTNFPRMKYRARKRQQGRIVMHGVVINLSQFQKAAHTTARSFRELTAAFSDHLRTQLMGGRGR